MDMQVHLEVWRLIGIGVCIFMGGLGVGIIIGKERGWKEGARHAAPPSMRRFYD